MTNARPGTAVTALAASLIIAGGAVADTAGPVTHMPDDLRNSVSRIVILPVPGESGESITGTYDKETKGLYGGIAKGAEMGRVPVEVGQVPVNIPIPILREIGMIFGGITGAAERYTQELRDRMTEDLASAVEQPLSNIALATDVFWGLRDFESLDPRLFAVTTPIPENTDAILYIYLDEVTLNIQKDEAIVTTTATARLQKQSDGTTLYRTTASYSDRDQLRIWARDDYALWREYREFARHYLGRELIADLYSRVDVDISLEPVYGDVIRPDKKIPWHGKTRTLMPTLGWAFNHADTAGQEIRDATVSWDVEIYDTHHPVFGVKGVHGTQFKLDVPLEPCATYRWSVRPAYTKDGRTVHGAWMRRDTATAKGNGNDGRAISTAHAYIQDFASFEVDCRAR